AWLLTVQHQAVVSDRPRRTARHLFADEPVFGDEAIVGERILVEDVAELAVELRPFVVAHLEQPVLDAHRVVEVLAEVVLRELGRPAVEVPAVEQLDPFFFAGIVLLLGGSRQRGRRDSKDANRGQARDHAETKMRSRHAIVTKAYHEDRRYTKNARTAK